MLLLLRADLPILGFRDPDDAMRLTQVRDWIGGQAFWDVSQHRVNPPLGGPMHWSRVVDMPVALIILILTPLVGAPTADIAACSIAPLILLGGLTVALFIAARRLMGNMGALTTVALLVITPSVFVRFLPLRIDHHGWQTMLAGLALCGAIDQRPLRGGIITALSVALWLQISAEALPYAAIFASILALRHVMARDQAPRFMAYVVTLGMLATIFLALLRGPQALAARYCDALSYVYVWPLVALSLTTACFGWVIGTKTAAHRALIAALGGAAAIAAFLLTGGSCLTGDPFASLGPVAYRLWYMQVLEGRPIWEQTLSLQGIILLPSLLGLGASFFAAREAVGEARMRWLTLTLLITGAILVSMMVVRALSVAHMLSLPGIGWLLMRLIAKVQAQHTALLRVGGSVGLILLTPAGLCAAWVAPTSEPEPTKANVANCRSAAVLAPLDRLPVATLFAPLDIGPDILAKTRHSVIGTAHHRNSIGITAVIQGFVDAPDQARNVILRTRASYLITCDGLNEGILYGKENGRGLAAMLAKGSTPDWLEPLPIKGPLHIWRIRRD
ncbi:hypothetical protein [Sphingobium sp.]|uniref:hypothetical protein n=1 Tax=Sphingobium sp. TaxID=1912891 RepID=UPI003B3A6DA9